MIFLIRIQGLVSQLINVGLCHSHNRKPKYLSFRRPQFYSCGWLNIYTKDPPKPHLCREICSPTVSWHRFIHVWFEMVRSYETVSYSLRLRPIVISAFDRHHFLFSPFMVYSYIYSCWMHLCRQCFVMIK